MWGALYEDIYPGIWIRFIPTHVGSTAEYIRLRAAITVHPHACGEHKNEAEAARDEAGSSPRMWGAQTTRKPV